MQVDIMAIERAARLPHIGDEINRSITIYTDSQVAPKPLASRVIRSKEVVSCREELSWIWVNNACLYLFF